MPTVLQRNLVPFIELCGVAVPIATNRNDERQAYKELTQGSLLALAIALPFLIAILFWVLWN